MECLPVSDKHKATKANFFGAVSKLLVKRITGSSVEVSESIT